MQNRFRDLLTTLGLGLLRLALRILPRGTSEREGTFRGLAEQRLYDRYEGYTLLVGGAPYSFDKWRAIRETFRLKFRGAQ